VIPTEWYWAVFVLVAAAVQTVRNAAQRSISGTAGVSGATQVRFLYGLPFAIVFFGLVVFIYGAPPMPDASYFAWVSFGAVLQISATAFLLAAMNDRNFAVAVAYSRTEPLQIAIFGLIVLGDSLTVLLVVAVVTATGGVIVLSWPKAGARVEPRPVVMGILSASCFALSAVGFRGAIQMVDAAFLPAATTTLVVAMALQAALTTLFMLARDRKGLRAVFSAWKVSLLAGFTGALASQLWFSAFALESAARVRTLGVIEILFAQIVSARMLRERASARELLGIVLVVMGVVLVLNA